MTNATLADLGQEVYADEIALGASAKDAAFQAICVMGSPAYRAAWLAERADRLRERQEKGEVAEQVAKDAEDYCGNPEEWEVRGY